MDTLNTDTPITDSFSSVAADAAAHDAFVRLYTLYGARAQSLAFSRLHQQETAEDIAQQAFLQVWRKMQGEAIDPETEWAMIAQIVVNLANDTWRRDDAQRRNLGDVVYLIPTEGHFADGDVFGEHGQIGDDRLIDLRTHGGDPLHLLIEAESDREAFARIMAACRTPRQKQVALMWMQDYSQDEIAAAIGMSIGVVKTDLHRLRARLGVHVTRGRPKGRSTRATRSA